MNLSFQGHMSALLVATCLVSLPSPTEAQVLNRLKDRAARAAESEVGNQVDRLVRSGVACLFDDLDCIENASKDGDDVYLTDENGDPVVDAEGNPVTDPDEAARILGKPAPGERPARPGEGAWANYDFVPGDEILFVADYADDNVGDFPMRFELSRGSFDVVEWEGKRYMRALSGGILAIPLTEPLPERFTIETSVSMQHGNASVRLMPGRAFEGRPQNYEGSAVSIEFAEAGVLAVRNVGPESMTGHDHAVVQDALAPLRIMADGRHMKVYLGARRVANVPNAVYPRTDTLFVAFAYGSEDYPILMGPVRIASGGSELYDRLSRDGRVATQGILFDVDSDRIRPESTPTLKEIGTMLEEYPDLRISIEGHTDADGDEAYNLELSERRATSVRQFLIDTYGIEAGRLRSQGFGESAPVAPNDTPEGKQENRRVELVRLEG